MQQENIYTIHYRTRWTSCDNVVIQLFVHGNPVPLGIVEVTLIKEGKRKGEGYIWNLHVDDNHRRRGYARRLLHEALYVVEEADCEIASLEWNERDTPVEVCRWYEREGFEVKAFGRGCAYMVKKIEQEDNGED